MWPFSNVKFIVKNSNGGTLGGFANIEDAMKCKAKFEKEYASDPINAAIKVYVEEI